MLIKKYKSITRYLWAFFDKSHSKLSGCPAVNIFYVNPKGDVLPCPYIQMKAGNIKEEPLSKILANAWKIPYFSGHSEKCLAGEDLAFARKFLNYKMSVMHPIPLEQAFTKDDYNKY
jgi:MoaA/NifB/PqqE/SkfB family radical SAM enzyme